MQVSVQNGLVHALNCRLVRSIAQSQNRLRVFIGDMGHFRERDAAQIGQHLRDARQLRRRVAPLRHALRALLGGGVQPMRRDVGRVGFKHDGREGQCGGQAAQLQGTLKGERTTKAEFETHLNERMGLLQAAIKCMCDATFDGDLTQTFEQRIGAATHMQHDGQLVLTRQLQLCAVKVLLLVPSLWAVDSWHKTIQANFSYCDQLWISAVLLQGSIELL